MLVKATDGMKSEWKEITCRVFVFFHKLISRGQLVVFFLGFWSPLSCFAFVASPSCCVAPIDGTLKPSRFIPQNEVLCTTGCLQIFIEPQTGPLLHVVSACVHEIDRLTFVCSLLIHNAMATHFASNRFSWPYVVFNTTVCSFGSVSL